MKKSKPGAVPIEKPVTFLIFFPFLSFFSHVLSAQDVTWVGGDGYWDDGANFKKDDKFF